MSIRLSWDAGHSLTTPGKRTPDGEREWSFNTIVGTAFANELSKYNGIELRRFDDPSGNNEINLNDRIVAVNKWEADYHISFHHNAYQGMWGNHTGVETYVYSNPSPTQLRFAQAVHPALVKGYGLRDRGVKRQNFAITRDIKKGSERVGILLEGGFMDSHIDINVLRNRERLENAGREIAWAVANFLELEVKQVPEPNDEKDAKPSEWAKEAVQWAKNTKPVAVTDGTFLKRPITREEAITIIYRAIHNK